MEAEGRSLSHLIATNHFYHGESFTHGANQDISGGAPGSCQQSSLQFLIGEALFHVVFARKNRVQEALPQIQASTKPIRPTQKPSATPIVLEQLKNAAAECTTLASFKRSLTGLILGGLVRAAAAIICTTNSEGPAGMGTVFEVAPPPGVITTVASFNDVQWVA